MLDSAMIMTTRIFLLVATSFACILLAACGSDGSQDSNSPNPPADEELTWDEDNWDENQWH